MKKTSIVSYVEEDGFKITRGDNVISVYGTAEAEYTYCYEKGCMYMPNGDPGYPDEEDIDRTGDLDCWVDDICDEEGNPLDTELTDEEFQQFEEYMESKLDDKASVCDFSSDYEDERI